MRRRPLVVAAIVLIILAGAYTFYWFRLRETVAADLAAWVSLQRLQGFTVTLNEQPAIEGFPFVLRADLGQPDIAAPGGLWRWQGPDTVLRIRPWQPFSLFFEAPGHHHLAVAGNAPRDIALDAASLVFSEQITSDNTVTDFSLDMAGAAYADSVSGMARLGSLAIAGHLPHPAAADPNTSFLDLATDATAIDLPASVRAALGQRIDRLHLVTQLTGAVPQTLPREGLAAWRDSGGVLQVRESQLDWGPLSAAGDGTIALDENMQPLAAGTVSVSGLPETLDLLSSAGLIESGQATLAKMMFGAVAQTPAGGGRPQVKLPLTIQNSYIYMGPIKLAPLKPIDWSQVP